MIKGTLAIFLGTLLMPLAATYAAASELDWQQEIATRRAEYLDWVVEHFGKLEPTMAPTDGRRWALNHARLFLDQDAAKANEYFESFAPPSGDADIYFIRFLRTLLDFRDSPRLSDKGEVRIVGFLKQWPQNDLTTRAHWPPRATENHDLMNRTLGLFAQQYREGDIEGHVHELKRFLAHRGRWDSKAISKDPEETWPQTWPHDDDGAFDAFQYSCFLMIAPNADRAN